MNSENNVNVNFTESEANELLKLLDAAVKFGGLSVAGAATHFHDKMLTAFKSPVKPSDKVAS